MLRWVRRINRVEEIGNAQDFSSESSAKINVIKSGDRIDIYVPSKTNPNRFMKFAYTKVVSSEKNMDAWLQTNCYMYTKENEGYNLEFQIDGGGDQEGVLRIDGEADYIGGNYHGYLQNLSLDVIIDGNDVDMTTDFNMECSHVQITNQSEAYHHGTNVRAFLKTTTNTWDLDTYTIEGDWEAVNAENIISSKLSHFSIQKVSDGKNIIKWGRNDLKHTKVDVSLDFTSSYLMTDKSPDITKQELWSDEQNLYLSLKPDYDRTKYAGSHYIEDFGERAKIYFDLGSFTVQSGERVRYTSHLDFRY